MLLMRYKKYYLQGNNYVCYIIIRYCIKNFDKY